jgi:diguanylate cyclase (GGDEF)-like protein
MIFRPSITQYSLVFIIITSIAFGVLGFAIYNEFTDLEHKIGSKQSAEAAMQLRQNLARLDRLIEDTARDIGDWQETRQQLAYPAYYEYWRDSRVISQSFYFSTIQAIELYNHTGKSLADHPREGMPKVLDQRSGYTIYAEGDEHSIFYSAPINSDRRGTIGYILLKIKLEKSLADIFPIQGINMSSLRFDANAQYLPSLTQLVLIANYTTKVSEHAVALRNLVNENLYRSAALIVFLSVLFIVFAIVLIVNPIRKFAQHISGLESTPALSDNAQPCSFMLKELQLVCNSMEEYHLKISEMNADLDEKNRELWLQAHNDALTGVFNRRAFEMDWQHIETAIQGSRIDIAFMLIDCDRFKTLNDTYGHNIGDKVLIEISSSIQQCLRDGDKLYRLGGDEFATLFLDASKDEAAMIAQRCVEKVGSIDTTALGISEPLQVSIGLACTPATNIEHLHELHHQADTAMYQAKRPGKSKIAIYDDSMLNDSLVLLNNHITSTVHSAITTGESLELHFQAVVDCQSDKIDCYEVLVRINDSGQLMYPDKIFPVIHDRRVEVEFDTTVIKQLDRQLADKELPENAHLSINLSGLSILSSPMIERLLALANRHRQNQLCLEITETSLMNRLQQASENLEILREAGFEIMLDDFGNGYSSIRYLTRMPIDGVKFDISLVQTLNGKDKDAVIVESLAKMILEAGYRLVAEGIEDQEIYSRVREVGFTHAQGYYLHKPVSANALGQYVSKS